MKDSPMTTEILEPGTHVRAYGYNGTVTAYDTRTNSYTVEIGAPAEAVKPVQPDEPTELGVYKLSLAGGGNLIAQKIAARCWVVMGWATTYEWPPVKGITGWERIA